jgi:hypothetical protein
LHDTIVIDDFIWRTEMKNFCKIAISGTLLLGSAVAFASPHLTSQQCNDYPFRQPVGEITHAQLMQELSELEAVGYNPGGTDATYPTELMHAEKKLRAEYRQDCTPQAHATAQSGSRSE